MRKAGMTIKQLGITLDSEISEYLARNQKSREAFIRAQRVMPGGTTRNTVFFEPYPPTLVAGRGSQVEDLDGNIRLDLLNNYTALILGHADRRVVDAVTGQVGLGSAFAAPTQLESRLGELIQQRVPSVDLLRFANSGTEATMQAMRLARAFTDRDSIAVMDGSYHGTHDWAALPGPGIPSDLERLVLRLPFNDPTVSSRLIEANRDRLAAVIVEPIMGAAGMIPADAEFLRTLREVTRSHNIVLIFDEVMVFRVAHGGAQSRYGVSPDLTAFAKIIGGGYPVAAWGGRRDIMQLLDPAGGSVSIGGTYNGSPVGLAAGIATMEALTPAVLEDLNEKGQSVRRRLNALFRRLSFAAQATGMGSLFNIHGTDAPIRNAADARGGSNMRLRTLFMGLMNRGFFLAPRGLGCISAAMSEKDLDRFVAAVEEVARGMVEAGEK